MIAGIVLAAGSARRMGALKQLLPMGRQTVIEVVVERVAPCVDKLVVVLGHRAREVAAALQDSPAECVVNREHAAGMLTSVQCGIRAAGEVAAYLVCLGDQPAVDHRVIEQVVSAAASARKGITIPTWAGRGGHPVLVARRYGPEILALSPDQGLHAVTRGHPEDTLEVPVGVSEILDDMDTPEDYQRELARYRNGPR